MATESISHDRALIGILRQIADEKGVTMTTFSQEWLVRLEKSGKARHVFGYNFELNSSTAQILTNDKSAVADLLSFCEVPHVEHQLFLRPHLKGYVGADGNWGEILAYAELHGFNIVCKSNTGTGGNEVFRAQNRVELERAVHTLFQSNRAICLSPFYPIESEYRLVMLGGKCELCFGKKRPTVDPDGVSTVLELIVSKMQEGRCSPALVEYALSEHAETLDTVPARGSSFEVGWQHNLGKGAHPVPIRDEGLLDNLAELGERCAKVFNLKFASVDVVSVNHSLRVLEINAGVMLESYIKAVSNGYETAKRIYGKAVELMFESDAYQPVT